MTHEPRAPERRKPELVCPAGSLRALQLAVDAGADAVYLGLKDATNARNFSQCDSMLIGNNCSANTFPYIEIENNSATLEHEATTSKISAEQVFYLQSRGLDKEQAISLIINGFCKEVFKTLPPALAVEAATLLEMKLEGSVG